MYRGARTRRLECVLRMADEVPGKPPPTSPKRILLADDHPLIRKGFRHVLSAEPDLVVVGEAHDGHEAVDLAGSLQPDVLLLDVMMPRLNGLEAIIEVVKVSPQTRILVVSMHDAPAAVTAALKCGAAGYVLKDSTPRELVLAVRHVLAGRLHIGRIAKIEVPGGGTDRARLSDRETQVLMLVALGYTSRQLGRALGISARTADVHRAHIMKKLELTTLADLIRYAYRSGLIPPDR